MNRILIILLAIPAFLVCLQLLPNAAVAAEVEIYTASYCSECKRAKAYMYANRIVFNEHDIEKDIERRREFYARGGKAIPYIFVNGQAMHGFDVERFERLRTAYK